MILKYDIEATYGSKGSANKLSCGILELVI